MFSYVAVKVCEMLTLSRKGLQTAGRQNRKNNQIAAAALTTAISQIIGTASKLATRALNQVHRMLLATQQPTATCVTRQPYCISRITRDHRRVTCPRLPWKVLCQLCQLCQLRQLRQPCPILSSKQCWYQACWMIY